MRKVKMQQNASNQFSFKVQFMEGQKIKSDQ